MENMQILGVAEFTSQMKNLVEKSFSFAKIRGELSDLKFHRSGHVYGVLREGNTLLDIVFWKYQVGRLKVKPEEGLEVIASGKITVYGARSRYQMIIDNLEIAGRGALLKLLHERREKLFREGLFDHQHKQKIPELPDLVGVISAPDSAAMNDIARQTALRIGLKILIWPSLMQGDLASSKIIEAIEGFNNIRLNLKPDVIIIARGGGSLEDLMPFNDEELVRAVYNSKIPIVSAIGHESDNCLLDEVADIRAATPSAAAEIVAPDRNHLNSRILSYKKRIEGKLQTKISLSTREFENLYRIDKFFSGYTESQKTYISRVWERFLLFAERTISLKQKSCDSLKVMAPQKYLEINQRAYDNKVHRLEIVCDNLINFRIYNIKQLASLLRRGFPNISNRENALRRIFDSLQNLKESQFLRNKTKLDSVVRLLNSFDQASILKRGFTLVRNNRGDILKSSNRARLERRLKLQFSDGMVAVNVEGDERRKKSTITTHQPSLFNEEKE